jgi:hypothetical protein
VAIVALFYTADLSGPMLGLACLMLLALVGLNRAGVERLSPYLLLAALLWVLVLKSGVHATLAGVAAALTIPLRASPARPDDPALPLHRLEHALHPFVAYAIVPVFGFANAGVSFAGLDALALLAPVSLGVAVGLFVGKRRRVRFLAGGRASGARRHARPGELGPALRRVTPVRCWVHHELFIGLLAFPDAPAFRTGSSSACSPARSPAPSSAPSCSPSRGAKRPTPRSGSPRPCRSDGDVYVGSFIPRLHQSRGDRETRSTRGRCHRPDRSAVELGARLLALAADRLAERRDRLRTSGRAAWFSRSMAPRSRATTSASAIP